MKVLAWCLFALCLMLATGCRHKAVVPYKTTSDFEGAWTGKLDKLFHFDKDDRIDKELKESFACNLELRSDGKYASSFSTPAGAVTDNGKWRFDAKSDVVHLVSHDKEQSETLLKFSPKDNSLYLDDSGLKVHYVKEGPLRFASTAASPVDKIKAGSFSGEWVGKYGKIFHSPTTSPRMQNVNRHTDEMLRRDTFHLKLDKNGKYSFSAEFNEVLIPDQGKWKCLADQGTIQLAPSDSPEAFLTFTYDEKNKTLVYEISKSQVVFKKK